MKPIITKFNDKTGDFEITIPVPFTLKDGIEYVDMVVADIPKYEDKKDYNVFDLIRENQELKKQLSNDHQIKMKRLQQENRKLKQQISNSHQMKDQQKEFIEYLESEMILFQEYMKEIECSDRCHGDYPITYYTSKCRLTEVTEILSKYKEIIAGNNDQ